MWSMAGADAFWCRRLCVMRLTAGGGRRGGGLRIEGSQRAKCRLYERLERELSCGRTSLWNVGDAVEKDGRQ